MLEKPQTHNGHAGYMPLCIALSFTADEHVRNEPIYLSILLARNQLTQTRILQILLATKALFKSIRIVAKRG